MSSSASPQWALDSCCWVSVLRASPVLPGPRTVGGRNASLPACWSGAPAARGRRGPACSRASRPLRSRRACAAPAARRTAARARRARAARSTKPSSIAARPTASGLRARFMRSTTTRVLVGHAVLDRLEVLLEAHRRAEEHLALEAEDQDARAARHPAAARARGRRRASTNSVSSMWPARGTASRNDMKTPIRTQNSIEIATAENAVDGDDHRVEARRAQVVAQVVRGRPCARPSASGCRPAPSAG